MRVLAVAALLIVALPAAGSAAGQASSARLSISVWPEGHDGGKSVRQLTLRCRPSGGSHPTPARACARLYTNLGALKPVPRDRACIARFYGRQEAVVTGTLNGRRIRAVLNRRNGCEQARWARLAPLFRLQDPPTSLQIIVWPDGQEPAGRGGKSFSTSLTCGPAGGTHPNPTRACAQLAANDDPFGPEPTDRPCVLVRSGPQVAVVRGSYRGKPVETRFDRSDSCETRRWDRVSSLFEIS
jgi:Subtilisin inhibitor-like